MAGWLGRTIAACVATAAVGSAERPAEACSPPQALSFYAEISDGPLVGVPTDGVIAFRATTYGPLDEALALLSIAVTSEGVPVPGAIETVEFGEGSDFGIEVHHLFVVWRPDGGFMPAADYVASITVQSPDDPGLFDAQITLDVATGAGPAGALALPILDGPALEAMPFPFGPRVCCEGDIGACGPDCMALDLADQATLSVEVGAGDDPMLSQSYMRALAGQQDALEPYATLDVAVRVGDVTLQRSFAEPDTAYCIAIEMVSLIDATVSAPVVACLDHGDLVLDTGPNPGFEAFAAACEAPYWEDTNEPYVPVDDTTGGDADGGDAEGSGSDGGGSDGGGSDGGDADGGDADSGSAGEEGSGDGGQDADARGCACDIDHGSPAGAPMLWLVALGIRRRRAQ